MSLKFWWSVLLVKYKQKSPAVKRDSICMIISVGTAGFEPATLCL